MMAAALSTYIAGVQQIVIVGPAEAREKLARAAALRHLPFAVTLNVSADRQRELAASLPLVASMQPIGGKAAVYVCRDFTCKQPVTTPEELGGVLADELKLAHHK